MPQTPFQGLEILGQRIVILSWKVFDCFFAEQNRFQYSQAAREVEPVQNVICFRQRRQEQTSQSRVAIRKYGNTSGGFPALAQPLLQSMARSSIAFNCWYKTQAARVTPFVDNSTHDDLKRSY